ncbi:MAG: beta-galactosidase trimerization domain-containing protein, partial [bacterium]
EAIRKFACNGPLPLVSYADVRYSRKIQTIDEANQELFTYVKGLNLHGKKNTETVVYAMGGMPKAFYDFYGISLVESAGPRAYVDWRGKSPEALTALCQKLTPEQRANIFVVSLGDEITLMTPTGAAATTGFVDYLKGQGVKVRDVDPDAGNDWSKISYSLVESLKQSKPGLYYWSNRYHNHYGVMVQKLYTDVLRQNLPNAQIGANFSCHHGGGEYSYLGEVYKWINCFRQDGMTLPWAEDYVWQVPVGSPQMNSINLDLFRAGNRGKPNRKIMYYVMPHYPGNTPAMWRRLFYNAVGHGATIMNLFEFDPVWTAYTENHVTSFEMYAMVLRSMRELGLYEDIIQSGTSYPAATAIWFSETGDIWRNNLPSFGAAKRALYVAILGQQLPLDFVVDQDAAEGNLKNYQVLYLTDNNVSRSSSEKIAEWVKNGGRLFATAGAGMFDELNQPNAVLRELLGVEQSSLSMPAADQISFIKQDLPFAKPLDVVTLSQTGAKVPVFGITVKVKAAKDTEVRGTFGNGEPAVVVRKAGKGETLYCAFLPALSYFKPAIPLKPLDRGSTDDSMAHLIPTEFDAAMGDLIGSPAAGVKRPVVSSERLVECNLIQSKAGTAIVVVNWSGKPVKGLKLSVNVPAPTRAVTLASGRQISAGKAGNSSEFEFDLDLADVVIMR